MYFFPACQPSRPRSRQSAMPTIQSLLSPKHSRSVSINSASGLRADSARAVRKGIAMPKMKKSELNKSELKKSESKQAQQPAIEAVARHFSAAWESADGAPDAYLTVRGKKIALDVADLMQQSPRKKSVAKVRFREDKVAQRVLRDLESALNAHVPTGKSIILPLGAPIRVANKLVVSLTSLLVTY